MPDVSDADRKAAAVQTDEAIMAFVASSSALMIAVRIAELERLTAENARLRGLIEPTEANVERVARALCEIHIWHVRRHDTPSREIEAMLPAAVDYAWRDHSEAATAALNALDPET